MERLKYILVFLCVLNGALGAQLEVESDHHPSIRDQLNSLDFAVRESSPLLMPISLIPEPPEQPQPQKIYHDQLKSIGFGELIKFAKIDSITQLEPIVAGIRSQHLLDSILIALDWDNTISLRNGHTFPLREGAVTTEVLQNLATKYNVQFMILTSRLIGYGPDDGKFSKDLFSKDLFMSTLNACVQEMHAAFPLLKKTPVVVGGKMMMGSMKVNNEGGINRYIIADGIVFSGSHTAESMKGPVFVEMMKLTYGLNDFNHIVIVDNEMVHIDSLAKAFIERADKNKLTLVHYPQLPPPVDSKLHSGEGNK